MKLSILVITICLINQIHASFLSKPQHPWAKEICTFISIQPQNLRVYLMFKKGPYKGYTVFETFRGQMQGKSKPDRTVFNRGEIVQTKNEKKIILIEYEKNMRLAASSLEQKNKSLKSIFLQTYDDNSVKIIKEEMIS